MYDIISRVSASNKSCRTTKLAGRRNPGVMRASPVGHLRKEKQQRRGQKLERPRRMHLNVIGLLVMTLPQDQSLGKAGSQQDVPKVRDGKGITFTQIAPSSTLQLLIRIPLFSKGRPGGSFSWGPRNLFTKGREFKARRSHTARDSLTSCSIRAGQLHVYFVGKHITFVYG